MSDLLMRTGELWENYSKELTKALMERDEAIEKRDQQIKVLRGALERIANAKNPMGEVSSKFLPLINLAKDALAETGEK